MVLDASEADRSPHSPPLSTESLPKVGGRLGPEPEDFRVDEVPLYPPSGSGEHFYLRLRKRGFTTREAVRELARVARVDARDVGSAGMKDKHAVTTQWLSVPAAVGGKPETWALPPGLEIVEVSRHTNKLRTGHLTGNRFEIRLVDVEPDALSRAHAILDRLSEQGLPNRFGAQRFGRGGENLRRALAWIDEEAETGRSRAAPFEQKLWSSVLQAEAFNRYLTERLRTGLGRPLAGEVVRLEGTGSSFVVEDPERELPRWKARDIHPTGPIFGPKMRAARGRPLELEEAAIASVGIRPEARLRLGRHAHGTRRDLLVWPGDPLVVESGAGALVLSFFLPAGSYATELVREFTRRDLSDEGRQ